MIIFDILTLNENKLGTTFLNVELRAMKEWSEKTL